jgi:hypothetical protein
MELSLMKYPWFIITMEGLHQMDAVSFSNSMEYMVGCIRIDESEHTDDGS